MKKNTQLEQVEIRERDRIYLKLEPGRYIGNGIFWKMSVLASTENTAYKTKKQTKNPNL